MIEAISLSEGGGFLQFLLVMGGLTCFVAGTVNAPRHAETAQLEQHYLAAEQALADGYDDIYRYRNQRIAIDSDPHYREFAVRWSLAHRLPGELTVEEYVRAKRAGKHPVPATLAP